MTAGYAAIVGLEIGTFGRCAKLDLTATPARSREKLGRARYLYFSLRTAGTNKRAGRWAMGWMEAARGWRKTMVVLGWRQRLGGAAREAQGMAKDLGFVDEGAEGR